MEKVGQHFRRCRVAGLEPCTEQRGEGPTEVEKRAALSSNIILLGWGLLRLGTSWRSSLLRRCPLIYHSGNTLSYSVPGTIGVEIEEEALSTGFRSRRQMYQPHGLMRSRLVETTVGDMRADGCSRKMPGCWASTAF